MSTTTGDESKTKGHMCPHHEDEQIALVCVTCKILICISCSPNHDGHDLKYYKTDGQVVQKLCRAQSQEFSDINDILEALKNGGEEEAAVYQEVKTKVFEKIDDFIQEAKELKKQIDENLDQAAEIRKKNQEVVCERIKSVDRRIDHLHSIRKIKEADVLIPEVMKNTVMLEEFSDLEPNAATQAPVIGDIMPNLNKFDALIDTMKDVFKVDTSASSRETAEYDYTIVSSLGNVDIPDKTTDDYIICEGGHSDNSDHIVLYRLNSRDLHTYDIESAQTERTKYKMKLNNLVKLCSDKYVAADEKNNIKLIENTEVVHTQKTAYGKDQGMCYHSPGKIIKLNRQESGKFTLTRIAIPSKEFVIEHEIQCPTVDDPWFIASHKDEDSVSMLSESRVYTVNMTTEAVNSKDISSLLSGANVRSLYVDRNDNVLVGDEEGNIHVFDKNMSHQNFTKINGAVWGITIRNDELFASASAKVWRFKLSTK